MRGDPDRCEGVTSISDLAEGRTDLIDDHALDTRGGDADGWSDQPPSSKAAGTAFSGASMSHEARLIRQAREAKMATLANVTTPDYQLLPEADRAWMDHFFGQLMLVLPMVGFGIVEPPAPANLHHDDDAGSPTFVFSTRGALARARETGYGFVVLAGSTARRGPSATFQAGYRALRNN